MEFDLTQMTRRALNPRRNVITIRDISSPATMATDLYRSVYMPVVQAWEAAAPRIIAEYERDLALVNDGLTVDNDELQNVDQGIFSLILALRPDLVDWALRLERRHRNRWTANVLSATSVSLDTIIGLDDVRATVQQTIDWNVDLVSDVSAQTKRRISTAVFDGLQRRANSREVAKAISEATGIARRRSQVIAADQLVKITSSLSDARRRQAGIDYWRWRHSGKLNPRHDHVAREGVIYSDNPDNVGQVVNDQTVRVVPDDRPGQLPYCGCRSQSVLVFE